ncbi:hypothetical protein OG728_27125 [Streptomyces microflavus]|uniref:hypothetical protein n=1 Tax=Streptomyces TaxID=1883 RepID=UPI000B919DD7|nr:MULTISPECIES: hypothetical protein [Streptomyces]MBK3586296.1 hypothetical protein [Streptomyces sp. MBT57]OXY84349.1 hypothetical protein BEH93_24995 [Streptomyces sp. 2R]WSR93841.1 hypothetical protein OG728_27125 [Streptomyces microflavus]
MNLFLDYLTVIALFVLLALPAAIGFVRERRIDRQLRDAERGEAARRETESAARPYKVTRRSYPKGWAKA